MDIFSHGLWAGAAAKAVNKKSPTKLKVWHAIAWGVFPDLFAFTPAFVGLFWLVSTGQMNFSEWPGRHGAGEPMGSASAPVDGPATGNSLPAFQLASHLYNFSHSIFIFILMFGLAWLLMRRPVWEMGGWLLHIIMDIPTHSYAFFPTPIFWPLFGWKFNGFSWAVPWFLILDYGLLIIVYWLLRERKTKIDI
ncbi:MAG: hypothetical protein Q7S75_00830 [bacterium]|nr:hypothetical protein [bacterium]